MGIKFLLNLGWSLLRYGTNSSFGFLLATQDQHIAAGYSLRRLTA